MFTGLNAFPLTPLDGNGLDERAFTGLVHRLHSAGVDEITALGSTGSYAYLTREERGRVARAAVENAGDIPVAIGVGALRTTHVFELVEDAQVAGASGVLLAPVSYQPLTASDVFGLYDDVTRELSIPLAVYDNPATTRFTFTDELYQSIAALPHVASIKIPGVPVDPAAAADRIAHLRSILPPHITIGVAGDAYAATGLGAGCDTWYSVIAGTLPDPALALARAAISGDVARASALSARLQPLWDLFARHGSLRVIAAVAEHLGLVSHSSLPLPIRGLDEAARTDVARICQTLDLD